MPEQPRRVPDVVNTDEEIPETEWINDTDHATLQAVELAVEPQRTHKKTVPLADLYHELSHDDQITKLMQHRVLLEFKLRELQAEHGLLTEHPASFRALVADMENGTLHPKTGVREQMRQISDNPSQRIATLQGAIADITIEIHDLDVRLKSLGVKGTDLFS